MSAILDRAPGAGGMSYAIEAKGLGKRYRVQQAAQAHRTLVDALSSSLSLTRWRAARGGALQEDPEDFWALRELDVKIEHGEAIGVIGRNGAGKSTLLKILSRVTEPTTGRLTLRGRVASLLEVGTGFHMELSGRENIYLNGAILGMRRAEIARRFDAIVDYSGVEKFLELPLKRYSSGMYVRLAFAVAAFLESEILVVDEVLAVGDMAFQKKCLGTMHDAARSGRTVLFVSHNTAAIANLTRRCLLLDGGRVGFDGPTARALEAYSGLKLQRHVEPGSSRWPRSTATAAGAAATWRRASSRWGWRLTKPRRWRSAAACACSSRWTATRPSRACAWATR